MPNHSPDQPKSQTIIQYGVSMDSTI